MAHERGGKEWETDLSFSTSGIANPRDYLTIAERKQIREAALDYLQSEGYETGEAGGGKKANPSKRAGTRGRPDRIPPASNPTSRAGRLQRQAEQSGINTLTHDERWRVACRLLKWGWEPAWDWFKRQYGPNFKSDVTWEQFNSAVTSKPEWYAHVEVPPKPR